MIETEACVVSLSHNISQNVEMSADINSFKGPTVKCMWDKPQSHGTEKP